MLTIQNRTKYCLGVNTLEFVGFVQPNDSLEVPDDVARDWSTKSTPAELIRLGLVVIAGVESVEDKPKRRTSVRKAIASISEIEDLDELEAMFADESRPKVLEAIEARMSDLTDRTPS